MIFKGSYDSAGAVPQEFKDKYTEVDGKFMLTGSIESKDASDFKEVLKLKQSSFDEMHGLKEQLKAESQAKDEALSKNEILQLQVKDGADPAKLQELVETKSKIGREADAKTIEELRSKLGKATQTIDSGAHKEFVDGIVSSFSSEVEKESRFILSNIFEKKEDGSRLTKEAFGLEAGLNSEQAKVKLTELYPSWAKKDTAGHQGGGTGGDNLDKRGEFNELLKKQQGGEKLDRNESIKLSELANQIKNEE